jgi:FKBP-type peptidyl-prolyl cis-trans isomerase FkpA
MSKRKIIGLVSGVVLVAGTGTGLWVWQKSSDPQADKPKLTSANRGQTLAQTSDPNSIPLNRSQPQSNSSSGLSLAPDTSVNNLGQLTPNGDGSGGSSSSSSGSSQPKALDPGTFGEYEKYKDGESALFGDMQSGSGDELTMGKKAAVYYKGWLTNGQLFDMSRPDKDGNVQPFVFELGANQVIPGWEQALAGMKVGGTRLVIVPPAVGYGPSGQGNIPGNSVLIFQVQLLAVQ